MKRWIHSRTETVFCMSLPRGKVKDKIEAISDIVLAYVCKCVLYADITGDYNHWVEGELANWISMINDLTVKPGNKKLKEHDYDKFLLSGFGNDMADARINLNLFYNDFRKSSEPYPEVNITNEMVVKMYNVTTKFHETIPKMLSQANNFTQQDIAVKLHDILDPICKGE